MDIACTKELYKQAKTWLEDGHEADRPKSYSYTLLMKDPAGVIDSLLLAFEDTYGTVLKRRGARLYTRYEEQIHDTDPVLQPQTYGRALAALADMDLITHDTTRSNERWDLADTDPQQLTAVKQAAHDPDIQQLYG